MISNLDKQGLRHAPFCFTEQGVTMLSCVLNSDRAIRVNIRIIRIFTRLREMLLTHKDILLKLETIEKKLMMQDGRMKEQEDDIQMIFAALKKLLQPREDEPRPRVGFRRNNEKD